MCRRDPADGPPGAPFETPNLRDAPSAALRLKVGILYVSAVSSLVPGVYVRLHLSLPRVGRCLVLTLGPLDLWA